MAYPGGRGGRVRGRLAHWRGGRYLRTVVVLGNLNGTPQAAIIQGPSPHRRHRGEAGLLSPVVETVDHPGVSTAASPPRREPTMQRAAAEAGQHSAVVDATHQTAAAAGRPADRVVRRRLGRLAGGDPRPRYAVRTPPGSDPAPPRIGSPTLRPVDPAAARGPRRPARPHRRPRRCTGGMRSRPGPHRRHPHPRRLGSALCRPVGLTGPAALCRASVEATRAGVVYGSPRFASTKLTNRPGAALSVRVRREAAARSGRAARRSASSRGGVHPRAD